MARSYEILHLTDIIDLFHKEELFKIDLIDFTNKMLFYMSIE